MCALFNVQSTLIHSFFNFLFRLISITMIVDSCSIFFSVVLVNFVTYAIFTCDNKTFRIDKIGELIETVQNMKNSCSACVTFNVKSQGNFLSCE